MSRSLCRTFQVSLDGDPIQLIQPMEIIQTGIAYAQQLPDSVPWFEADAARIEAHYNVMEWDALPYELKVREIAHYRLRRHIMLHEGDARVHHDRMKKK